MIGRGRIGRLVLNRLLPGSHFSILGLAGIAVRIFIRHTFRVIQGDIRLEQGVGIQAGGVLRLGVFFLASKYCLGLGGDVVVGQNDRIGSAPQQAACCQGGHQDDAGAGRSDTAFGSPGEGEFFLRFRFRGGFGFRIRLGRIPLLPVLRRYPGLPVRGGAVEGSIEFPHALPPFRRPHRKPL